MDEITTLFQGTAAKRLGDDPNPVALSVGKQGTFTIKVRNNGGEAARNVRLEVDLPESVSVVQVTPNIRPTGTKLTFNAETVPAYGESVYTITYESKSSAHVVQAPPLGRCAWATSRCRPRKRWRSRAGGRIGWTFQVLNCGVLPAPILSFLPGVNYPLDERVAHGQSAASYRRSLGDSMSSRTARLALLLLLWAASASLPPPSSSPGTIRIQARGRPDRTGTWNRPNVGRCHCGDLHRHRGQ